MAEKIIPQEPNPNKLYKIGTGIGLIVINKEGKLLLGKRHDNPEKTRFRLAGTWSLIGGKMVLGDDFEEAAIREAKEETGMTIINPKVFCVNNDINQYAHFVTVGLIAESYEGEPQVLEPDEMIEWKWFDINNLPDNMYFPSLKVIENYLQKKFYIKR